MKEQLKVRDLYPELLKNDKEVEFITGPTDYNPIINKIGNVIIKVDDDDFSGDSRIMYQKHGMFAFLIFGWGSCSGNYALQSCENTTKIQELIDKLVNGVTWFDSLCGLQKYFSEKDWTLDYSCYAAETKEFVSKVLEFRI